MRDKEARARIKINKLLEESGWRFFPNEHGMQNIQLEGGVDIPLDEFDKMGKDFEHTKRGFIDYILLDNFQKPVAILEAKRESIHPLNAKEQARKYAESYKVRFVFLSNGNMHYLWDLEKGNPKVISKFPTPESLGAIKEFRPDKSELVNERVERDYIAITQYPNYAESPDWIGIDQSHDFIEKHELRFLRPYQLKAVHTIQEEVKNGTERFLFEMATGTGKTLTAGAIIKLFLRTGNAKRVLFLVDRLELERQAKDDLTQYLGNDYDIVVYKEKTDSWNNAEIVVSTIQTLLANDKYKLFFSPTDFDFLISDEAHRSIGGNSRAVFEYFHGYKLGLTATPKDYLKGIKVEELNMTNPKEYEIRLLKDTYVTFGCEDGEPTFRYSLIEGVKDDYLRNPVAVDARTEITTQLLSDEGYAVIQETEEGEEEEVTYYHKDFEKKFFSDETNYAFSKSFMENAMREPISNEIGKTIVFCVSQAHARKITEVLNEIAEEMFPGKYNSDFAVQVTSFVYDAQQMTINFKNNRLNGHTRWLEDYRSSRTRVCCTVGMMTTGYDCRDILNICLLRPIFSPSDFIQIKGRGTRKYNFKYNFKNEFGENEIITKDKKAFKLFDFFANCEFFEEKFDYEEKLIVRPKSEGGDEGPPFGGKLKPTTYESQEEDDISIYQENVVGEEGMKIDRMMYMQRFEDRVRSDEEIKRNVEAGNWDQIIHRIKEELFNKPEEYFNLEKLQKAANIDRKLTVREVVEKIFGIIPDFKSKDELLEEEFQKFISIHPPGEEINIQAIKYFFKAYIIDQDLRRIIEKRDFQELYHHPTISMDEFKQVDQNYRKLIPDYVRSYVKIDKFAA